MNAIFFAVKNLTDKAIKSFRICNVDVGCNVGWMVAILVARLVAKFFGCHVGCLVKILRPFATKKVFAIICKKNAIIRNQRFAKSFATNLFPTSLPKKFATLQKNPKKTLKHG